MQEMQLLNVCSTQSGFNSTNFEIDFNNLTIDRSYAKRRVQYMSPWLR